MAFGRAARAAARLAPALATVLTLAGAVAGALVLVALLPSVAHAWTPGTHIFIGEAVMRSSHWLPAGIAELLRAFPYDFLYGSIAADTSIAKKYVPAGRHCHSWNVGLEIYEGAKHDEPPLYSTVGPCQREAARHLIPLGLADL